MLIIHSSPVTLSWGPRGVDNGAYNFGGIVTVGEFTSAEDAKRAARDQYSVPLEQWRMADLGRDLHRARTEVHTPEVDGHKLIPHDAVGGHEPRP